MSEIHDDIKVKAYELWEELAWCVGGREEEKRLIGCAIMAALATKDATIAELTEDRRELLMAIENAARMAEQGILSADGGQCAGEIRALVPARFRVRADLEETR